jgi:hypothetical protein
MARLESELTAEIKRRTEMNKSTQMVTNRVTIFSLNILMALVVSPMNSGSNKI